MATARTDVRKFNQEVIQVVIHSLSVRFPGQPNIHAFQTLAELWQKKLDLHSPDDDDDDHSDDDNHDSHVFHHAHQHEWQSRQTDSSQYQLHHQPSHAPSQSHAPHLHHTPQNIHHHLPSQHHLPHQSYPSHSSHNTQFSYAQHQPPHLAQQHAIHQHHQQMHQSQRSHAYHPTQLQLRGHDDSSFGRPAPYMAAPTWVPTSEDDVNRGYSGFGRGGHHLPQNDGGSDEPVQQAHPSSFRGKLSSKHSMTSLEFIPQVDGKQDQPRSHPQQQHSQQHLLHPHHKQPVTKHQYANAEVDDDDEDDDDDDDDDDEDENDEEGDGAHHTHNIRDRHSYAHGMPPSAHGQGQGLHGLPHHSAHQDHYHVTQQQHHLTTSLHSQINHGAHLRAHSATGSQIHQHHSQHYMGHHLPSHASSNLQAPGFVASQASSLSQLPGPPSIHSTPNGGSTMGPVSISSSDVNLGAKGDDDGSELGSYYDGSSDDSSISYQLILCQYEKVSHARNRWRCVLKDGVMQLNKQDYVFHKCQVDLQF